MLDKDISAAPERYVLARSRKGVQLPFKTTPDSPRVISPEWAARGDKYYVTTLRPRVRNFNRTLSFDGVGKATAFCYNDH